MKNNILSYIYNNPDIAIFDGNNIIVDFDAAPARAVTIANLIKKHFNVLFYTTFGFSGCFRIQL